MKVCGSGHGYPYTWQQVEAELYNRNRGRVPGKQYTATRCGTHWHVSKRATGTWPPKGRELAYYGQQAATEKSK